MWVHLIAAALAIGVLIGPTFLALAQAPPITAAASWTPVRLLAVSSSVDLSAGSCIDDPPLHAGPVSVQGRVVGPGLKWRLTTAVFRCAAADWTGDVTISADVDAGGTVTDVRLSGDTPPRMQRCLSTNVLHGYPIATRGPGTLHANYFMGRRR